MCQGVLLFMVGPLNHSDGLCKLMAQDRGWSQEDQPPCDLGHKIPDSSWGMAVGRGAETELIIHPWVNCARGSGIPPKCWTPKLG